MKKLLAVKKGDSYTGLKEWTEDEVIEIYERASNSGKDFYDALYDIFLESAGGDSRQAFRSMLDMAYQWFNVPRYGRPKPAYDREEQLSKLRKFLTEVPPGKTPDWTRFKRYYNNKPPFGRSVFYELKKVLSA